MTDLRPLLIVEDDDLTRAFLLDNLAADGFRVAGAGSVGEGLRAIDVRQPALVVLDLGLGDESGLALLDRVRAADGLASRLDPDLLVLVLSGRAGDADRVRSFARGADDHLCKPSSHLFPRCRAERAGDASRGPAGCARPWRLARTSAVVERSRVSSQASLSPSPSAWGRSGRAAPVG